MKREWRFFLVDAPGRKAGLFEYDQDLGWKNRPYYQANVLWPHRTTLDKINSQGLRDHEYPYQKGKDVFRIAVLGCSRTYGYGVNMEETYSKVLEGMLNEGKKVEVLNFGVNGYGLDQMTLHYLKNVRKYDPDVIVLQIAGSNIFRISQTKIWATQKPAFIVEDNKMKLVNSPVPQDRFRPIERFFVDHSYLYKFVKDKMLKIEKNYKQEIESNVSSNRELQGLAAVIAGYLKKSVDEDQGRLIAFTWGEDSPWIDPLLEMAGVEHFRLEDFASPQDWAKRGPLENPPPTGHWSVWGHKFVAQAIYNYLRKEAVD